MSNLAYRQSKIQEKRKQTPWRDFVMEICSRSTLSYYRTKEGISRYPNSHRVGKLISYKDFFDRNVLQWLPSWDFLQDFISLMEIESLPIMLHYDQNENSDFSDQVQSSKNCYLSTAVIKDCENVLYSLSVKEWSKNIYSSTMVRDQSENIYESMGIINSSNIFFSKWIFNSSFVYTSYNLINCHYCIRCHDLENKKYYVDNNEVSKEVFQNELKMIQQQNTTLPMNNDLFSMNFQCNWLQRWILNYKIANGNNLVMVWSHEWNKNMYDIFTAWSPYGSDFYAVMGVWGSDNIYCTMNTTWSSHIFYSVFMVSCSFCLWCIGLKNKSYCILNKQYSKEERYEKVDEIFWQMEKEWTLGEFFPWSMCPFYFNDTAAYLIDNSFTKEEVTAKWYLWRDEPIKVDIPEWAKVVKTSELGQYEWRKVGEEGVIARRRHDDVAIHWTTKNDEWDPSTSVGMTQSWYIDPEILNVIIQDEAWNVYRIVKMEYDFILKHWLPLPRKHRLDRMKENFTIAS